MKNIFIGKNEYYKECSDICQLVFIEFIDNKINYLYGLFGYDKDNNTINEVNYKEEIKGQLYKFNVKTINVNELNNNKYIGKYYFKIYGENACFKDYYEFSDYLKLLVNSDQIMINLAGEAKYNFICNNPTEEDFHNYFILNKKINNECINAYYNYTFNIFDKFIKSNALSIYIINQLDNKITVETINKIPYWPTNFSKIDIENSKNNIITENNKKEEYKNRSFYEKNKEIILVVLGAILARSDDIIAFIYEIIYNLFNK